MRSTGAGARAMLFVVAALGGNTVLADGLADDAGLAAVVVTATRTARSAYDIAASIDSVSLGGSTGTPGVSPSEYLAAVPGLLARNRHNFAQDEQISIRGFGARSTFGVRGVRLYTDGIPATMPDGQGQVSHFNLDSGDRIEVLRGPFSALYGNSSGGVIQLFTADGTDPPQSDLGVAAGSYGTWRVGAKARGLWDTWGASPFGYNLGVTHFETQGYRAHSAAKRDSGNAKLTIEIGTGGKLNLLVNALSLRSAQDPLGLSHAQFSAQPRSVAAVAQQYNTRKSARQTQGGATFDQNLGAGKSIHMLMYYGNRAVTQFLSVPVAAQSSPLNSGGVVDLDSGYGGVDARWTWHGALAARPFEITAGASYDRQQQHRLGYENFIGDVPGVQGRLRRDEQDTVWNFDQYAQASWQFTDAWSLSAGVRHSVVTFQSDDHYISAGNPSDSGGVRYTANTPVAGLMYKATKWAHVYASYGKGFETPTFNELAYRANGASGLALALAPARSHSGELGVKLRLANAAELNVALFRADTRDELAVATSAGGRTTYQNIGGARRAGVEASLSWRFADDLRLQFGYTQLDATFRTAFLTCSGSACATPVTPVAAGSSIPGIPRQALDATLSWGRDSGWRAAISGNYVSAVAVNDLGTDAAPSYFVSRAMAGYVFPMPSGELRGFLRLDNAFNRRYAGSVIINDANGRYFEPAPDRVLMLMLHWNRPR